MQDAAFSHDGRWLATSAEDAKVIIWDLRAGSAIKTLTGHRAGGRSCGIPDLAFSPDGRTLYTASYDSTAIIWDVAGHRRLGRPFETGIVRIPDRSPPAFALSPDGRTLAVARNDGRVDLMDAETLSRTGGFRAFHLDLFQSPFGGGGRRRSRSSTRPTGAGWLWPEDVASSASGTPARGNGSDRCSRSSSRRSRATRLHMFDPFCTRRPFGAAAAGEGGLLAATSGTVRIWDLDEPTLIRPPLRQASASSGTAFSPDGSRLAITHQRRVRSRGSRPPAASGSPPFPPQRGAPRDEARSRSPPMGACLPAAMSTVA